MSDHVSSLIVGRVRELDRIDNALSDSFWEGIFIEGQRGTGKSALMAEIHRRRGGRDRWVRGDRNLTSIPYGAFGLLVDLDRNVTDLPGRLVSMLCAGPGIPVVFIDNAHDLDAASLRLLWQLNYDRAIKLVVAILSSTDGRPAPFGDLVIDHILDHLILGPLGSEEVRTMIGCHLGGVVSQGVLEAVDAYSGRVPGLIVDVVSSPNKQKCFIHRNGVWILKEIDLDGQLSRDIIRADLRRFTAEQREALELVALAGETDVNLMLTVGLGESADELVAAGVLSFDPSGGYVYVAGRGLNLEFVRSQVPRGRSRKIFDLVDSDGGTPNQRSRMLRIEWSLSCGAETAADDVIDAARIASDSGQWHRALRLLSAVRTDRVDAHMLVDLGSLYCDVNRVPVGIDILAQALGKACCPGVVLDAFFIWTFREGRRMSPILHIEDFRSALAHVGEQGNLHPTSGFGTDRAWEIFDVIVSNCLSNLSENEEALSRWVDDVSVPEPVRGAVAYAIIVKLLAQGSSTRALIVIDRVSDFTSRPGTLALMLTVLSAQAHIQLGRFTDAKAVLNVRPSDDSAMIAARSGLLDLMWTRIHLEEDRLTEAADASQAAVEACEYWNQKQFMAIALAQAEYIAMLTGDLEAADIFGARFQALPTSPTDSESRLAYSLHLVSRAKITGRASFRADLYQLVDEVESAGESYVEARVRLELFRHFGDSVPESMCRLGSKGSEPAFSMLGMLGNALRGHDSAALTAIASAVPGLEERCAMLADQYATGSHDRRFRRTPGTTNITDLTRREWQISRLIIAGMTSAEIASELSVAVRTVEGHIYRLYRKLNVSRRDQVRHAVEQLEQNTAKRSIPRPIKRRDSDR